MEILKIKWCLYVSILSNFSIKHKVYEYYATLLSLLSVSCLILLNDIFRNLLSEFFDFSVRRHYFSNCRIRYLIMCLCCCFWPKLAVNLLERNCLWVTWGCFEMMCCVIVLPFFIWLKKAVFHTPIKNGTYQPYIKHDVKGVYQFLSVTEWYTIHNK